MDPLRAAATRIPVRPNPARDWQVAALLLATLPDPMSSAGACDRKDRQRLRWLAPIESRDHAGWQNLGDEAHRRGTAALAILLGT